MPQDKWAAYRSRMSQRVIPKDDTERYWFIQADLQELATIMESVDVRVDNIESDNVKRDSTAQFKITTRWIVVGIAVSALIHFIPVH